MSTPTEQTLAYYDAQAENFIANTLDVEFGSFQEKFTSALPAGGRILDLGCGSGRDALAFSRAGFQVDAVDGSATLAQAACELTGLPVKHALFESFEPSHEYEGIWACSSLLHIPSHQLTSLLKKYAAYLVPGGVFYLSFKLGSFEGMRNGRWFTDLTEDSFRALISEVDGLEVREIEITCDVRPDRASEQWLNAWCIKE